MWKQQVLLTLRNHGLEWFLDGSESVPPRFTVTETGEHVERPKYRRYVKQDCAVASWLLRTVNFNQSFPGVTSANNRDSTNITTQNVPYPQSTNPNINSCVLTPTPANIVDINQEFKPMQAYTQYISSPSLVNNNLPGPQQNTIAVVNSIAFHPSADGTSPTCLRTKFYYLIIYYMCQYITKNLMYVSRFAKDNLVYFDFHQNSCFLKNELTREVLLEGVEEEGLYYFPEVSTKQNGSRLTALVTTIDKDIASTSANCHFESNLISTLAVPQSNLKSSNIPIFHQSTLDNSDSVNISLGASNHSNDSLSTQSPGITEAPLSVQSDAQHSNVLENVHPMITRMYNALINNNNWSLVKLPPHRKPIGCKLLFKIKKQPDGTIER
ncbi:hypothetical protein GQ457_02G021480 [Hibiscus cannabinus]